MKVQLPIENPHEIDFQTKNKLMTMGIQKSNLAKHLRLMRAKRMKVDDSVWLAKNNKLTISNCFDGYYYYRWLHSTTALDNNKTQNQKVDVGFCCCTVFFFTLHHIQSIWIILMLCALPFHLNFSWARYWIANSQVVIIVGKTSYNTRRLIVGNWRWWCHL